MLLSRRDSSRALGSRPRATDSDFKAADEARRACGLNHRLVRATPRASMGVVPFRAAPTFFDRLRGHRVLDVARPIQQFAALLPHAENWFRDRTRSRFIVDGRLVVRRPA